MTIPFFCCNASAKVFTFFALPCPRKLSEFISIANPHFLLILSSSVSEKHPFQLDVPGHKVHSSTVRRMAVFSVSVDVPGVPQQRIKVVYSKCQKVMFSSEESLLSNGPSL